MKTVLVSLAVVAATAVHAAAPTFKHGQWTDKQEFKASAGDSINYYLFTPAMAKEGKKLPLVVWLHGGVKSNGIGGPNLPGSAFYRDEHQEKHPCFVLRPVAIQGQNWVSPRGAGTGIHKMPDEPAKSMKAVLELIDKVVKDNPIDEDRLYVTGASMGGYGTWDIIQRHPDKFAAAVPMCGGADPSKAEALKAMPIWITHGDKDPFVPVKASREMFAAVMKARGEEPAVKDEDKRVVKTSPDGSVRYVEYKGGNHNIAWDAALADPEMIEWMFSKTRKASTTTAPTRLSATRPAQVARCGRCRCPRRGPSAQRRDSRARHGRRVRHGLCRFATVR